MSKRHWNKRMNELKEKLWKNGKSASEYPKDYIVIPVLDAVEILNSESITKTN